MHTSYEYATTGDSDPEGRHGHRIINYIKLPLTNKIKLE